MVRYLLDTCILSELNRPEPCPGVSTFVAQTKDDQWISALSFGELVRGAHMLPTGRRRTVLLEWISAMEREFESRIVPVDVDTARLWGEIPGDLRRRGMQLAFVDGLIAATAIQHGMHVVTRNVKDFEPTGVLIVNPRQNDEPSRRTCGVPTHHHLDSGAAMSFFSAYRSSASDSMRQSRGGHFGHQQCR